MSLSDLFIDVYSLPDNGYGFFQLIFITGVYAAFLFVGANLISDGSELLLLIPSMAGLVGSVVLPVLGAVPDGALVLFSGLGSDAQYQLEIGIGALAGSTIMLLTIPWFLIIVAGRVDLDPETFKPHYTSPKLNPPDRFSFYGTGVGVSPDARIAAYFVMATALPYFVIEGAALAYKSDTDDVVANKEKPYAIVTLFFAFFGFFLYLVYSYMASTSEVKKVDLDEYLTDGIKSGKITLVAAVAGIMDANKNSTPGVGEETALMSRNDDEVVTRLKRVLRPFFVRYDLDKSNSLDADELTSLVRDLGENLTAAQVKALFVEIDLDKSGLINYDEFVKFSIQYTRSHKEIRAKALQEAKDDIAKFVRDGDNADEEEAEIPEDLVSLSYEEQQSSILFRSSWMMLLGTIIVLIFSDPMVDCLTELGDRIGVRPFYVAFVLAPLASNASEIVASYNYSSKKTLVSMNISMTALLGAAIMNNTFVLGIFMIVVYSQGLYYEYFAETIAILMVELLIAVYVVIRKNHTVFDAFMILTLYPLSLVVVYYLYLLGWG